METHVDTNTQTTAECASTFRNIGSALRKVGNCEDAILYLKRAMKIRQDLDIIETPDGASVLLDLARSHESLFHQKGKQVHLSIAVEHFDRGINIRRKAGFQ